MSRNSLAIAILSIIIIIPAHALKIKQFKNICYFKEADKGNDPVLKIKHLNTASKQLGIYTGTTNEQRYSFDIGYDNSNGEPNFKRIFARSSLSVSKAIEVIENSYDLELSKPNDAKSTVYLAAESCKVKMATIFTYQSRENDTKSARDLNDRQTFSTLKIVNNEVQGEHGSGQGVIINPTFPGTNLPFVIERDIWTDSKNLIPMNSDNISMILHNICYVNGYDDYVRNSHNILPLEKNKYGVTYSGRVNEYRRPKVVKSRSLNSVLEDYTDYKKHYQERIGTVTCIKNNTGEERVRRVIGSYLKESDLLISMEDLEKGSTDYPLLASSASDSSCKYLGYDIDMQNALWTNNQNTTGVEILHSSRAIKTHKRAIALFCLRFNN